jgi:plasmid stabilization system protein ParE
VTPIVVRPAAAADIDEAFLWYERRRSGLGDEFPAALRIAFEGIAAQPTLHAIIHRDTRRALLIRFPFGVFYRLYDDVVVIVACMHGKRNPRQWRFRA